MANAFQCDCCKRFFRDDSNDDPFYEGRKVNNDQKVTVWLPDGSGFDNKLDLCVDCAKKALESIGFSSKTNAGVSFM